MTRPASEHARETLSSSGVPISELIVELRGNAERLEPFVAMILDDAADTLSDLAVLVASLRRANGSSRRSDDPGGIWIRFPEDAWDVLRREHPSASRAPAREAERLVTRPASEHAREIEARANEALRERTVDLGFYTEDEPPEWVPVPRTVRSQKQVREFAEDALWLLSALAVVEQERDEYEAVLRKIADPTNHHYKPEWVPPEDLAAAALAVPSSEPAEEQG